MGDLGLLRDPIDPQALAPAGLGNAVAAEAAETVELGAPFDVPRALA